ncbi:hypothetical protein [Acidianus manzaensis]|uniref:DUF308 domain-containing protein n=1 Tax=Acidianus manzaensis TaxID=282676 RepID=A0A1W6JYA3_9CREN|nr:hypothetical protein [Acidianus manzaensis]ARM75225.1 hypothetical protein B6F84_03715 [Acidianus manzaensis]
MNFLKVGNFVSLVASLIILSALILLYINGINYAYSTVFQLIIWIIWILAIPSFLSYHKANLNKSFLMNYCAILAIVITFFGLIFLHLGEFTGIEIIFLGYILEPIAGISIFLTVWKISYIYDLMFFLGAIVFTAGLPLFLFNLGIISIIGDIVKMIGIIGLLSTNQKIVK